MFFKLLILDLNLKETCSVCKLFQVLLSHIYEKQKLFLTSIQSMHLQTYIVDGKRVYTLKKTDPEGNATQSAHPARFSPDDKFSRHRVEIKRRFKCLKADKKPVPV